MGIWKENKWFIVKVCNLYDSVESLLLMMLSVADGLYVFFPLGLPWAECVGLSPALKITAVSS